MNPHVKTKASVRKLKMSLFANAAKVGRVKLVKKKVNDKKYIYFESGEYYEEYGEFVMMKQLLFVGICSSWTFLSFSVQ